MLLPGQPNFWNWIYNNRKYVECNKTEAREWNWHQNARKIDQRNLQEDKLEICTHLFYFDYVLQQLRNDLSQNTD